ncbi:MAG: addiction module protein [Pyrinomonadaceae bacterium]
MNTILPLDQMTTADKLRAMEELWADLIRNQRELESPAWHETVLKQREERLRTGQETPIDWESAKKELRERLR